MTLPSFSFDDRLRVPEDVLMQELLEGESAFVNLETERYFGLGDMGTRLWTILTTADTTGSAYEALLAEFEVEPHRLRQDLHELIDSLLEQGLLRVESPARSIRFDE